MATKTKTNPYTRLVKAKSQFCKGKINQALVKEAAKKYVASAIKAGKTKATAEASAKRVLTLGCSISSNINKAKKSAVRKPAARKARVGRPRKTA